MRKYFHGSVLFLCILALFVSGCGGGSAADPMGTATVQFIDETGKVLFPEKGGGLFAFVIMPGETRQLIVWVTQARDGGKTIVPVVNEKVTFTLLTPGNGGSVIMVKDRTDANGRAVGMYTAGNNNLMDEVRATTESGASAHLTILKTGGLVGTQISSFTASSKMVAAYQTSVLTATVTDGNAKPVMGEAVTFTIPTNESDACFINAASACVASVTVYTDVSGNAAALYRGGAYSPYSAVSDTVQAALANGSRNALIITRSALTPLSIAVKADPNSLTAGQASTVTATLTGAGNVGVTVNFSMPVNNSGGYLSASSAVTDGSGNAVVSYVAGSNNPTKTVGDTVQAAAGSISASAAISRTGTTEPPVTPLSIAVAASPASVTAGQASIVTATLTGDNKAGVTVNFSLSLNNSGASLSASSAITDGAGKAVVTYTAGSNSPTIDVSDTVRAAVGSISSSVAITRTGTASVGIVVTALPASVSAGQASIITATLTGDDNAGVTVTFTLPVNNSGATLSASSAITDGAGNAQVTYQAGSNSPAIDVQDTVQAAVGSISSSVAITRTGTSPLAYNLTISAAPATLATSTSSSVITANLKDTNGTAVSGESIGFTFSGGTLPGGTPKTTDGNGNAVTTFTGGGVSGTGIVTATWGTYSNSVVINIP